METTPSYRYSFFSSSEQALMSLLKRDLLWERETLSMFGRDVVVPRKVSFVAEKGLRYRYTGKDHYGFGWPEWLLPVKAEAEQLAGQSFNCVLLNWYQNGEEYMGWHSDNEKSLGPAPVVAMLSLGAERDFIFRLKSDHKVKHQVLLEKRSWLIMNPSTQLLWQHSLPVRKRIKEERISLTFRLLL